jgi:hypothetical protein
MASSNKKIAIPVPTAGLRADIDRSVSDADMIVAGENVVSIDRTIRPRPCHRLSTINSDQGLSWSTVINGNVESVGRLTYSSYEILVASQMDPGPPPVGSFLFSQDGQTWESFTTSLPGTNLRVQGWHVIPQASSGQDLLWAPFVHPVTGEFFVFWSPNFQSWIADPGNVLLVLTQFAWARSVLGSDWQPSTYHGSWVDGNDLYLSVKELNSGSYTSIKFENLEDTWDDASLGKRLTLVRPSEIEDGSSVRILFADNGHVWTVWEDTSARQWLVDYPSISGDVLEPDGVYPPTQHGMSEIASAGYNPDDTSLVIVGGDRVTRFTVSTEAFTLLLSAASAGFKLYGHDGTDEFAIGSRCFKTQDGWVTPIALQSSPSLDMRQLAFIEYPSDPGNYDWYAFGVDPDGDQNVYDVPDGLPSEGECTSIFQVDLPLQPHSIFLGTTKTIFLFNRSTGKWENKMSTLPLSGSRENHPVIFRTFEQGGETWMLATNGVYEPVMWYEGIPGDEFIPIEYDYDADPNYPDHGVVGAPVASSMAIVGSRMVLAGVDGYGITFSEVEDHRRGWNTAAASPGDVWLTYALLGDTPGRIVSIQEITALQAAIYKEDAIYHLVTQAEFVGQNAPFRYELSKAGIAGPCSGLSIVRMLDGRQAYLANDGGVYLYDGVSPFDVGRHVRSAVQEDLDEYRLGLSWGMVDPYNKLLWFIYPTQNGKTNRGIILQVDQPPPWPAWKVGFPVGWDMAAGGRLFNFSDRSIGSFGSLKIGQVPDPIGSFSSGLYEMSIAKSDCTWYTQKWSDDGDYTDGGIPIDTSWTQGWEAAGDPFKFVTAQECQHLINSDDPNFEIGFWLEAEQANVNDILIDDIEYIGPSSHYSRTTHRLTGKRFAASFRAAITRAFKWGGLVMYHRDRNVR